ncbi:MAG: trehalose-phosphatase [Bdellovibrionales bacterium RIFOXYD1_FULL_53_11]|nr:MAG: trehalose-phosphatase [Bdellovibrionales bacterium RIFOXYD1_FULL_53_11]
MKFLFSATGIRTLEAFCFSKCLFAFDYDGTLAKIVKAPNDALMTKTTENLLEELNSKAPVAIISGRSLNDLKKLFKHSIKTMIGNHGIEGLPNNRFSGDAALDAVLKWKKKLAKLLPDNPGIQIEDKVFSLAVHYRCSREKKSAKSRILDCAGNLEPPPRVILGKCVINLIPAGAPHKGVALMELMLDRGLTCAVYVGDDDTDEDVFGLSELRIMTVRVGMKAASRARFYLKRQTDINRLIKLIIKIRNDIL